MKRLIELNVNGELYEVAIQQHRTLAEVLREELDLIGTKEACNQGDCGSCTVILDGKTVTACLILAVEADGRDVRTIEGISDGGELNPVQKAFVEYGAIQCGFCTPGMVMSATALLEENPNPTEDEVRMGIAGNICRCTGYTKIVEAILALSEGGK
ncbi:MAG: (2Fe-2S)-binding protein [Deltaproteobacteria bacterium]|nr:(2Fe-2S)-binding protein [Deltaproteobacteria bacterium]